ncbi:hypothetical protein K474DRAFT_1707907 [Panus rudis PR-1116 ss-1]|nr:hypothetical protein K474DRAFT_1707907 [Panus rudis PR-1116 ss-1]
MRITLHEHRTANGTVIRGLTTRHEDNPLKETKTVDNSKKHPVDGQKKRHTLGRRAAKENYSFADDSHARPLGKGLERDARSGYRKLLLDTIQALHRAGNKLIYSPEELEDFYDGKPWSCPDYKQALRALAQVLGEIPRSQTVQAVIELELKGVLKELEDVTAMLAMFHQVWPEKDFAFALAKKANHIVGQWHNALDNCGFSIEASRAARTNTAANVNNA